MASRRSRTQPRAVALLALLVAGVAAGPEDPDAQAPKVKRIAVVPILNTSGEKKLDAAAEQVADLLVAGLKGKPNVEVLERRAVVELVEELDFGLTSLVTERAAGQALANRAQATHIVQGSLYSSPDEGIRLTLRLVDVDRFLVEGTARWAGATGALNDQVGDRLARELLGLPLPEPENVRKARALYRQGEFLFQQEMDREAIRAIEQAVDLLPNDARCHLLLARCYARLRGRNETAIEEALRATRLDPMSAEAWFELGAIYLEVDRPEEAVAPLGTATRLAPGDAAAHSLLARAHLRLGRAVEAEKAAQQALAVDERWADAHNVLGHCYVKQGAAEKARAALQRAVALAPTNATFLGDLAQHHEDANELPLAIRTWEKTLELLPPRSARADFIRRHLTSLRERLSPPDD